MQLHLTTNGPLTRKKTFCGAIEVSAESSASCRSNIVVVKEIWGECFVKMWDFEESMVLSVGHLFVNPVSKRCHS